jgi:hypothetical protein
VNSAISTTALAFMALFATSAIAVDPGIRTEKVQFAKGSSSAVIKGQLKGDATVDYRLRAGAGQTLAVQLQKSNPQNYFNVLPPGSKDVAMYVGQTGEDYKGVLPTDGDYTIRVYLMRAAARRNESSDYTLTVGVTGTALMALPAAKDALIPGTRFHASAQVRCVPYIESTPRECTANVIRRGTDGTGTVELYGTESLKRNILFEKGKPVASDSAEAMTSTKKDDVTTVRFGADERYEIPDALLTGG